MLKRQESSLSSSRRLAPATPPPPETRRSKAIGCMSGIIHLFSKYQINSNKLLTFGRKREKVKMLCPTKDKTEPRKSGPVISSSKEEKTEHQILYNNARSSLESPTLPPEIRVQNPVKSPETPRTPSSLVAKLMGLEDFIISTVKRPAADPITEKRQQLIRALEKCNENLEGLKRIIQGMQGNGARLRRPQVAARKELRGGRGGESEDAVCFSDAAAAGKDHRRVFDEFSGSPHRATERRQNNEISRAPPQQQRKPPPAATKKPCDQYDATFLTKRPCAATPLSCRSPKVESVEEVCKDVRWGEEREMCRMVVLLQDFICRDLVEEIVKELKCCHWIHFSLPLHACKRRLSF